MPIILGLVLAALGYFVGAPLLNRYFERDLERRMQGPIKPGPDWPEDEPGRRESKKKAPQRSGARSFAMVQSDYPDDVVWDENDNPVSPGCRNLCEAIIAMMKPLGWQVDMFEQRNDFQWECVLKRAGERYDFVTHDIGDEKRGFSVDNRSRGFGSKGAKDEAEGQFLASLHDALMADPKVRRIYWSYDFDPDEDEAFDYPIDKEK